MRRGPFRSFLADLRQIGKQLLCIIRRKHDLHTIGDLTKRGGYRPIPLAQCRKCAVIVTVGTEAQEKRFGGKPG